MENPAHDSKHVIRTLTQGTPDEQHDALYRYFAPGAVFEHPFCRVPSFKNLHVPGVGNFDSRILINAIYRWYKILSPKIELEIESCAYDERANLIYLTIFQIFSIWFIPFYRAPVRLVTVLHLTPSDAGGAPSTPPPPPYDAAQEKRHAVQEGAEPSYAAVTAGEASASASSQPQEGKEAEGHQGSGSGSGSGTSAPTRYVISKQQDLYQVNEFLKFVALTPGSVVAGLLQLVATLLCLLGSLTLSPVMNAVYPPAKAGEGKEKKR